MRRSDDPSGGAPALIRAIRVFHLDDDRGFCQLVRYWFAEHPDLEHVGAATDLAAALDALPAARADVVLLDSIVGDDPGRDAIGELRAAAGPQARLVLYTGFPEAVARVRVRGDVDGYVQKASDDDRLVAELRALGARPSGE
jgi:DNA-binding NarL/FixJ family response regulator